jgi:sialidase-1
MNYKQVLLDTIPKFWYLFIVFMIMSSCHQLVAERNQSSPVIVDVDFNHLQTGSFSTLNFKNLIIRSKNGEDRILGKGGRIQSQCLFITGGEDHLLEFNVINDQIPIQHISFSGQRLSSEMPFEISIEVLVKNEWHEIFNDVSLFKIGSFSDRIYISIPHDDVLKFRIRCSSPSNGGLLLDDLVLLDNSSMEILDFNSRKLKLPVLIDKPQNNIQKISIITNGESDPGLLENIKIRFKHPNDSQTIKSVQVFYTGSNPHFNTDSEIINIDNPGSSVEIKGNQFLHHGENNFWISVSLPAQSDIRSYFYSLIEEVKISGVIYPGHDQDFTYKHRFGLALRSHNDDGIHTYRIPGLVTTNNGTLIAVYDVRRNSSTDLQGDIDIGMSRSINGGQTWEPMKVVMDMGNWGGLSEEENGIGDPSVLVDRESNAIWIAGVWAHGHKDRRNWTESKPGLDPSQTSQFMLVKSIDDGKSWSEPVNITNQVKKEEWSLLLQGPGKGNTLADGTLVFPAQFKDSNQIPYSTIIWSKDQGLSWKTGSGAISNTTESQVIELENGDLMLNMRDNRNREDKSDGNGRSVAITSDLGKTWIENNAAKGVLIEPVCMASIIKEDFIINGISQKLVLFSNPASKYQRKNISIRLSFDDAKTWPEKYTKLLDEEVGRGYSCMTKIDEQHIGILYESSRADLVFQVINIEEIIKTGN